MDPGNPEPGAGSFPTGGGNCRLPSVEQIEVIRKRAVSAVRRTCPDWLAGQAEDIVQNVMVQFLAAAKKSEGEKRFSAMYVEKAVYGTTMGEIRRMYRRRERPVEDLERTEAPDPREAGPERITESGEIAEGIQECLRQLGRPRRLAVTLYLQGCTVPSAAMHLRWTLKKTENLVYRGLADLRSCLAGKGLKP